MSLFDEIANSGIYDDNMPETIKAYLRDDTIEDGEVRAYWKRAVSYIEKYTGCGQEELEGEENVVHAMLAIAADMHDNRQFSGPISYNNRLVDNILDMYRKNLL